MKHDHRLATTTQTLALRQLSQINTRMLQPDQPAVTAKDLDLQGARPRGKHFTLDPKLHDPDGLSPIAVLLSVTAEGSPECPYVIGHFCMPPVALRSGREPDLVVTLHTEALHRLSQKLHLHHVWGEVTVPEERTSGLV